MKRNLYIFRGKNPAEWSETDALGPFTSEAKARKAIREDLDESLCGCETLSPGVDDDWAESYHIMEIVKSFQPTITAKVSVSLSLLAEPEEVTSTRDIPLTITPPARRWVSVIS